MEYNTSKLKPDGTYDKKPFVRKSFKPHMQGRPVFKQVQARANKDIFNARKFLTNVCKYGVEASQPLGWVKLEQLLKELESLRAESNAVRKYSTDNLKKAIAKERETKVKTNEKAISNV